MTVELKPFAIGDVPVAFPVMLASLAGYTDLTFRRLCRRFGAAYCATEMLLDKSVLVGGKLTRRLYQIDEGDHPVAGQLIGSNPDTMAQAAVLLEKTGFDVIDLNFACPVRKAISRRRGGHIMRDPENALEIVRAVIAAVRRPVTLKLRRRFADDGADDAFWQIAEGAFDAGAAALCVHARTVEQRYAGRADWDFLAEVRRRFPDRVLIGSGDVLTPSAALDMLERTGMNGASVARGVLGNPWFFRQARDLAEGRPPYRPSVAEQRALLAEHMDEACRLYGPLRGPKFMRKFGIKYARLHPTPAKLRVAFVGVKRASDWRDILDEYYTDSRDAAPAGQAE